MRRRRQDRTTQDRGWTAGDAASIIANPLVVGMGPFPRIVDDEAWITANRKLLQELGAERYLRQMLRVLRDALGDVPPFPGASLVTDEELSEQEIAVLDSAPPAVPLSDKIREQISQAMSQSGATGKLVTIDVEVNGKTVCTIDLPPDASADAAVAAFRAVGRPQGLLLVREYTPNRILRLGTGSRT